MTLTLSATTIGGSTDPSDTGAESPAEMTWQQRFQAVFGHLGVDAVMATRTHGRPDFTGTTWDEGLAWLRGGVTAVHRCQVGHGRWPKHKVRFHPDGSMTLLRHEGANLGDEVIMGVLAGFTPTCIELAIALTPDSVGERPAWTNGNGLTSNGKMRTLHTMVAWAQREDADWTAIAPLLRAGVTPATLDAWLADGWTFEQAKPFLLVEADMTVANAWRAVGQFTQRVAALAKRGLTPDTDDAWTAVGFTPAKAQRWRVANLPDLSPADCKGLDDAGWNPTAWRTLLADLRRTAANPNNPPALLDRATALAWATAGVPSGTLLAWIIDADGDLAAAMEWAPTGIHPSVLSRLRSAGLDPTQEQVLAWKAAGASVTYGTDLLTALSSGITPAEFTAALADHPNRSNRMWYFSARMEALLDLRGAQQAFLRAGTPPVYR